jgi:xylulokinase
MQIFADVLGKPFHVMSDDTGTGLGAAILAGIGTGIYRNATEAAAQTVRLRETYTPNSGNHGQYQKYYALYRKLYEDLRHTMDALAVLK